MTGSYRSEKSPVPSMHTTACNGVMVAMSYRIMSWAKLSCTHNTQIAIAKAVMQESAYENLERDEVTWILATALPVEKVLVLNGDFPVQSMLRDSFLLPLCERFGDLNNGVFRAFVYFGMSIP